jgi:hypothetical protein
MILAIAIAANKQNPNEEIAKQRAQIKQNCHMRKNKFRYWISRATSNQTRKKFMLKNILFTYGLFH